MKRTARSIKQPTRFADMVPFATSSSENEPSINRKRLSHDSGSIENDIQQLKSALTNRSKTERQRQHKHSRNTLPSKHSLSQPLLKINSSSHSKFPLTKSFSQKNSSVTPYSSPDRNTNVDSHGNRSLPPHLSPDCNTNIDSHGNRSLSPHSSPDRNTNIDSHRNRSLTPHSSPDRNTNVDSHRNRSLTPHSSPDRNTDVDSHRNRSLTPHSSPDRNTNVDSHRNRSLTPHSSPDRNTNVDSHGNRSLSPHSSPDSNTNVDSHRNRSLIPHSSPNHTVHVESHNNHSLYPCSSDSTALIVSHSNRSSTVSFAQSQDKHKTTSNNKLQMKRINYLDSHKTHKRFCHDKISPHDYKRLRRNDSKTRSHDSNNNISRPLQITIPSKTSSKSSSKMSSKTTSSDDFFVLRSDIQNIARQIQDLPKRITDQLGLTIRNEVRNVIKGILAQSNKVPCKPACLPLKTTEDIEKFHRLPNEEYDNVVRYLSHVGGWTARSCANAILKEAANDEVFHNFTFTGYKGKYVFKALRFAKACEEAMAANPNFKLTQAVFKEAITEALRSSKQRFRNRQNVLQVENNGSNSDNSDKIDLNSENENL